MAEKEKLIKFSDLNHGSFFGMSSREVEKLDKYPRNEYQKISDDYPHHNCIILFTGQQVPLAETNMVWVKEFEEIRNLKSVIDLTKLGYIPQQPEVKRPWL